MDQIEMACEHFRKLLEEGEGRNARSKNGKNGSGGTRLEDV